MISFGISLQDRQNELPVEVALWLFERNDLYPDVDFRVDVWDVLNEDAVGYENRRLRFSQLIHLRTRNDPTQVTFMYPKQTWHVRIIGHLTPEERREIAQLPENTEEIGRDNLGGPTVGIPFKFGEKAVDYIESVPVEPHMYTTGLSLSAAEFHDIVKGPHTERKEAIMQAMSDKNWDKAKELLKQSN